MPDTQGRLCEGTGSNVFLVLDGRLITPSLATGCLAGVTRDLVLEWSGAIEVDVPMSALAEAEEIFITSSTRDVQPVHRVDSRSLAAPGPVTTAIREDFLLRASADVDP
jgi:branched-chain amino acid aminotransferase